jgi:hypothetical protein
MDAGDLVDPARRLAPSVTLGLEFVSFTIPLPVPPARDTEEEDEAGKRAYRIATHSFKGTHVSLRWRPAEHLSHLFWLVVAAGSAPVLVGQPPDEAALPAGLKIDPPGRCQGKEAWNSGCASNQERVPWQLSTQLPWQSRLAPVRYDSYELVAPLRTPTSYLIVP